MKCFNIEVDIWDVSLYAISINIKSEIFELIIQRTVAVVFALWVTVWKQLVLENM
jgi:hypothetical protein